MSGHAQVQAKGVYLRTVPFISFLVLHAPGPAGSAPCCPPNAQWGTGRHCWPVDSSAGSSLQCTKNLGGESGGVKGAEDRVWASTSRLCLVAAREAEAIYLPRSLCLTSLPTQGRQ